MKNEPDIIKQLREEEKQGILYSKTASSAEYINPKVETQEKEVEEDEFSGGLKRIHDEIDIDEFKLKYQTIFENYGIAIIIADNKERIISWNEYTEELLNMGKKELFLRNIGTLYPSNEWKKIRELIIRQKGMQYHLETKIWTKKHELIDVDISISVLKDHNGKIIGSIGVIKNITEQKKIENELALKHDLLTSLLENIPDCIYFKDINCEFIKVNNAKAKRAKTTPEKMIGKTEKDFFPKDYAKNRIEEDKKIIKTGKSLVNKVEKVTDEKGIEHWVSITKVPRYNEYGEVIGTVGINREITDIKKSETKYKNIFEKAIDPIVVIDKNGIFLDVNKQVQKLLGYSKKNLIGKHFDQVKILTKESINLTMSNLMKCMKGESIPPYEIKVLNKNQEIIPTEINASILADNKGIIGELVILRDLRERYKRTKIEKDFLESERKFREIFDSTSDFLIYLEKGIILDINLTALQLANLEKKDIIGKHFKALEEIFNVEDIKKHLNAINNANKGLEVKDYETKIKTKKGTYYEFLFSVDIISDEEEIKGILLRGRDITARQRAWEELVKLEERYRILAETSADGVITIDPIGRLTYINPSFEKMINRRKSQVLATLFRDYLSEDSVYFFQQIFIDARMKNEKIENIELGLVLPNGSVTPIEVNIAPYKKDEDFAGMVCTIRDITERRRIEDELKKSERLKREFMNIAAHELKSPVTPIKGYLELIISDKKASNQIKDWAKISLRNSERLLNLVNDILDVSRLDTDTMRFELEKIPIVDLLDEISEDMKASVENKDIKFKTKIPRNLPSIMGNRYRLAQVLKNLLVNALKFTDNGSISILAEQKKDYIVIEVKDTGIGISKDEVKKIFNKFYQAYTGDDRKNEGTGLGLFICKEILKKHNGDIWVESQIGIGSSFYIKLPYVHNMVINNKK